MEVLDSVRVSPVKKRRHSSPAIPITWSQLEELETLQVRVEGFRGGLTWENRHYVAGLRRVLGRGVVDRRAKRGHIITVEVSADEGF